MKNSLDVKQQDEFRCIIDTTSYEREVTMDEYRKGQLDMAQKILELLNENKTKAELKGEILDLCYQLE